MADFPWNNFRNDNPQPQPAQPEPEVSEPVEPDLSADEPVEDMHQFENDESQQDEPVEENESDENVDGEENVEDETDEDAPADESDADEDESETDDENDEDETAAAETPAAGRGHRVKKNGTVPTFDRWAAKKLMDCINTLNTESGAAAAKTILGAGTSDPATLLAQLSEKKNRKRVNEVAAQVKELTGSDDTSVLMMNLALAFSADKDLAKSMMGLFNAVAPEKDFGRSTGDPRKDARNVASKWGDGLDLSVISTLAL